MLDFCIRRCQYWILRFQNCSDGISRIGGRFRDTMAGSIGCHDLGDISVGFHGLGDFRYWVLRLNTSVVAVSYESGTDIGRFQAGLRIVKYHNFEDVTRGKVVHNGTVTVVIVLNSIDFLIRGGFPEE